MFNQVSSFDAGETVIGVVPECLAELSGLNETSTACQVMPSCTKHALTRSVVSEDQAILDWQTFIPIPQRVSEGALHTEVGMFFISNALSDVLWLAVSSFIEEESIGTLCADILVEDVAETVGLLLGKTDTVGGVEGVVADQTK